ncbi:hypothetical protein NHX12_021660 [Muraenolepis orangiensis]|uniref:Uncharacterized protein n=1 Tax=Muraenolepis orangiensis TaxID=630683 RepID=A0A9Q0ETY8_9TELE|nr:hypothetical protein NHX12_021660 [Muraenolepis orangiensis]
MDFNRRENEKKTPGSTAPRFGSPTPSDDAASASRRRGLGLPTTRPRPPDDAASASRRRGLGLPTTRPRPPYGSP